MPKNHWRVVAFAIAGILLAGTGLSLAALSNPKRFPNNARYDQYIDLLALSGIACTFVGIVVFLIAIRNTTKSMPPHLEKNANLGIGMGVMLQACGFYGSAGTQSSLALILTGFLAFAWGGVHYAQGKRYSSFVGMLGVIGIPGIIVLVLLPHKDQESHVGDAAPE